MKPHIFSFSFLALHSEEAQLPFCPCDALRNARVGTGVDDVVEGLFTDGITGIDVTAQDFPVRQSAAGMFVVNTYDFPYPVRITLFLLFSSGCPFPYRFPAFLQNYE